MTGLLILIGGVALFGYFWCLKNKEERNNQPTPNFMEMYAQVEKKHFEQIQTMPTRKMDKYIAGVPNAVRDNQIEAIIYDAIICYSKCCKVREIDIARIRLLPQGSYYFECL